jgi:hypothetical protein
MLEGERINKSFNEWLDQARKSYRWSSSRERSNERANENPSPCRHRAGRTDVVLGLRASW